MTVFVETEPKKCKHGHVAPRKLGRCVECLRISAKRWRDANPKYSRQWQIANKTKTREHVRKAVYGLTVEDVRVLFLSQNRRCPVCERPGHVGARGEGQPHEVQLVVEHCHATGRVRGLVCQRCNLLISNHTSKMLRRAADFVAAAERV